MDDRREADRKWRKELQGALEAKIDALAEQLEEFKEILVGGLKGDGGLQVRFSQLETKYAEIQALTAAIAKTVHGDVLGRNSLVERVKDALSVAEEAKRIAEDARKTAQGKIDTQTSRRGQNITLVAAILSLAGMITMASLTNWEKIQKSLKRETTAEKLERIQREIEEEKLTRGPEIKAKLREIERAARYR